MKSFSFSKAMVLAAPLAMLVAAQAASANLILNGDFSANASSYVVPNGNNGLSNTAKTETNPSTQSDWIGTTNTGVNGADVGWTSGSKTPFGPSSVSGVTDFAWIHFQSSLYQSFTVTPGTTYTVTYLDAAQAGNYSTTNLVATLTAYVYDGTTTGSKGTLLNSNSTIPSNLAFNTESFNFTAGTSTTDTLFFSTVIVPTHNEA
ncbi:MAG: hypothetical protein ACP5O1_09945, partial [Phycisphaerae bacterium]